MGRNNKVSSQNRSRLFLTDGELKNILVDYFENCGEEKNASFLKKNWQNYSLSFDSSSKLWFICNKRTTVCHKEEDINDAIPADYPVD